MTPTPIDRATLVAPEALPFHEQAKKLGLPAPFDTWPVATDEATADYQNGFAPYKLAYNWCATDIQSPDCPYEGTFGIHTGVDYYTIPLEAPIKAICDGVIIDGRTVTGGSSSYGTGGGLSLRCFQDDPADTDNNGSRNLSNIVVTYNHLSEGYQSFSTLKNSYIVVYEGEIIGKTSSYDTEEAHLHLEMFFEKNFIPAPIYLNPLLMYQANIVEAFGDGRMAENYNKWSLLGIYDDPNDVDPIFWTNPTDDKFITADISNNIYSVQTYTNVEYQAPDCLGILSSIGVKELILQNLNPRLTCRPQAQ